MDNGITYLQSHYYKIMTLPYCRFIKSYYTKQNINFVITQILINKQRINQMYDTNLIIC